MTPDEERIRRMLFVLVISYIVSSWMVDFEYRPTFFMFTAAIAALHRHLSGLLEEKREEHEETETAVPVWHPQLLPQPALAGPLPDAVSRQILTHEISSESTADAERPSPIGVGWNWRRLGIFDVIAILLLTSLVIRFWAYIMMRM
jgi:hypothetical protein